LPEGAKSFIEMKRKILFQSFWIQTFFQKGLAGCGTVLPLSVSFAATSPDGRGTLFFQSFWIQTSF